MDIKLFTKFYITEHDKLSAKQQEALINWVEEASTDQISYLLLNGKIPESISEQYSVSQAQDILAIGIGGGIYVSALIAAVTTMSYQIYKHVFSKAARACQGKVGLDRKNCMNKAKQDATKAKIVFMKKGIIKCSKTKDPANCKRKLENKIKILKAQLGQL
jgi:hypothetical protein